MIPPTSRADDMAPPRRKPATGTARELSEGSAGYSASGESAYSRGAAHSTVRVRLAGHVPTTRGRHTLGQLIAEQRSLLAKLRGDIALEERPGATRQACSKSRYKKAIS